jgi:transposase
MGLRISSTHSEGEVHGHSLRWYRSRQERLRRARRGCSGQARAGASGCAARQAARTVAMEACSGAHHWARLFAVHGHTLRLIAPKFVAPYRMSGARGKNDAADAAAICEAVQRPNMRFVPVKSIDQLNKKKTDSFHRVMRQALMSKVGPARGVPDQLKAALPAATAANE